MELKRVLVGLEDVRIYGEPDIEIKAIKNDSRKVEEGDLFVAIKGFVSDGHQYLDEVIHDGAAAVMVERGCVEIEDLDREQITVIEVSNTRRGLAISSTNFYGHPSREFTLIGITGTKGKTTISYMLKDILVKAGKNVGLMGTIAVYINDKKVRDSVRTTPESIEVQKTFRQMADAGVEYVIMEVSSQSLKLNRVDGCEFDFALFTNFSKDHISPNEHPNMEDYFTSKLKLFEVSEIGITNADDRNTARLKELFPDKTIKTYGIYEDADVEADDIEIGPLSSTFNLTSDKGKAKVVAGTPGQFSVYNALAAISIAEELGIEREAIIEALKTVRVPGRFELVDNALDIPIIIDYAHSPKSLESILRVVKSITKNRLISVFGCGGDRDREKRAQMGKLSGEIADFTIITSDNPRTERAEDIIAEIERGIKKTDGDYEVIVDRTEAIERAIRSAEKGDIILLAGKGHETYQEIGREKVDYDERVVVGEITEKILKDK